MELLQAIESAGITPPPEIISDGTLHRFSSNGDRSDKAGYYCFFDNGGGFFGCWRTMIKQTVNPSGFDTWTDADRQAYRQKMDQAKAEAKAEQEKKYAEAATRAKKIGKSAAPAPADFPYLIKKQIKPNDVKISNDGRLINPVFNQQGKIQSLQYIAADGDKRFLSGSCTKGGFMTIGGRDFNNGGFICEGWATGCSIYEATGKPAIVAYNTGNLPAVAEKFKKYPLIICAENDLETENKTGKNPGVTAAKAAAAVSGLPFIVCPVDSDFNDLHCQKGLKAVKQALSEKLNTTSTADDWNPELKQWPELDQIVFRGIAGRFVELACRKSEADPAAVLITFLVRIGVEIGRKPFVRVGDTPHYLNLMAAIVGQTSKARKGTSAAPIQALISYLIRTFCNTQDTENRLNSYNSFNSYSVAKKTPGPLSTGEGLIWAVRDPIEQWTIDKKTKKGEMQTVDPGIEDKRLYVEDQEFASGLKCTKREGNTLATAIRCLWDDGTAEPLTKTSRAKTTGAHIGIITHITNEELLKSLDEVEAFTGFSNRFDWFLVRRQGFEPFPEPMPEKDLHGIAADVFKIVTFYEKETEIKLSDAARQYWAEIYKDLSTGYPGFVGGVLNRAEAQVTRLSLLYACLDMSWTIEPEHIKTALALWRYVEQSAFYIFGNIIDPTEQKILDTLADGPKTGTELHKAFSNNIEKPKLTTAINSLLASKKITFEEIPTGGRPKKLFYLYELNEINEKNNKSNTYNIEKVRNNYEIRVEDNGTDVSDGFKDISGGEDTVIF
jgi:phage/plasmid primase-like uncharacterized protein